MSLISKSSMGFLLLCFFSTSAFGWGNHYLVTDRSLDTKDVAFVNEQVEIESLAAYLKKDKANVAKVFADYYAWLAEVGNEKRVKKQTFDVNNPTQVEFLRAARLNTDAYLPMVRRLYPGEKTQGNIPYAKVSPFLKPIGNLRTEFIKAETGKIKIRDIVATYCDEPDWGFDHELFKVKEYGYGEQPYGKPKGESSKAPFHVQFSHENFLVKLAAGHITEGMTYERVELFSRLAKNAFDNGHKYWAYRFLSWAIHYVQDLCQPYHSKAVPFAGAWYYIKFVFSFDKAGIQERTTQLITNRHFAYEDFVAYSLEQDYIADDPMAKKLKTALRTKSDELDDDKTPQEFVETIMDEAADHAPDISEALVVSFGPKLMDDPKYDIEADPNYNIVKSIEKMDKKMGAVLLKETTQDYRLTGTATRAMILWLNNKK